MDMKDDAIFQTKFFFLSFIMGLSLTISCQAVGAVCIALLTEASEPENLDQVAWTQTPFLRVVDDDKTVIENYLRWHLADLGYFDSKKYYSIQKGGISGLAECFRRGDQEIIIVAHSLRLQAGSSVLMTVHADLPNRIMAVTEKDLVNLPGISERKRHITFVTCNFEELLNVYGASFQYWRDRGATIDAAPPSSAAERSTGRLGARSVGQAGLLAAEAIYRELAKQQPALAQTSK